MSESPNNPERLSGGSVFSGVVVLGSWAVIAAGVGLGLVKGYQYLEAEKYPEADASKPSVLVEKDYYPPSGGGIRPGRVPVSEGAKGERFVFVFEQVVENGHGDRAKARGRSVVPQETYDAHDEGEVMEPNDLNAPFRPYQGHPEEIEEG